GYTAPGSVAYLSPVADTGDSVSPLHNWDSKLTVTQIQNKWPSIGKLVDIKVTKRNGYGDWGGRVLSMNIVGTSATVTVTGYGFMNAFPWPAYSDGLYGNWFRVLVWKGEGAGVSVPTLISGASATMRVTLKNTGTASWPVGGTVRLATSATSRFYGSGWISGTRPASVAGNRTSSSKARVDPGETAEFRVPLHAENVKPGSYRETYRVVNDGVTPASAWFSATIPVLPGWTSEVPNVVSNDSFELGTAGWTKAGFQSGDGTTTAAWRYGSHALILEGGTKRVTQSIAFAGTAGRRFTLAGWSRGDGTNANGGAVEINATLRYADGTSAATRVSFPAASHAWMYGEAQVVASKALASISVGAGVSNQTGTEYFDAIRLYESALANASFEKGLTGWVGSGLSSGDGRVTGTARDGTSYLKLTGDGSTEVRQSVALSGAPSNRLVLSAWNKTSGATASAPPPAVQLTFVHSDGTRSAGMLTFPTADHDWTYGEAIVRAAKAYTSVGVRVLYSGQTGTSLFDSIRITPNLMRNPGLESGLTGWTPAGFADTGDGVMSSPVRDGVKALKLTGAGRQSVTQSIALASFAGRKLLVSSITKNAGTSTSGGAVTLAVVFHNKDRSTSRVWLALPKAAHDWLFRETLVTAPKAFTSLDLVALVADQGSVLFDSFVVRL
ncbi:MAG: hypothetical protein LC750_18660, partial [Actinobacteria bacterium]|nr:hypothetical protein [Actinomycetota bacterium]